MVYCVCCKKDRYPFSVVVVFIFCVQFTFSLFDLFDLFDLCPPRNFAAKRLMSLNTDYTQRPGLAFCHSTENTY